MSELSIVVKESVPKKPEYRDRVLTLEELEDDWRDNDTSLVWPLLKMIRRLEAERDAACAEAAQLRADLSRANIAIRNMQEAFERERQTTNQQEPDR